MVAGVSNRNKSKARVCQTCGDKGFEELLLCCSKCQISEEHRYCLAEIPKVDDFTYICALCVLSSVKQTSFKQSPSYHSKPSQRSRDTLQRNEGPPAIIQDRKKNEASCSSLVSERVVAVETRDLPVSIQPPVSEPSVKGVLPEVGLNENDRSTHQCDVNIDGDQETKRKRRRFFHGACEKSDEVVEDRRIQEVPVAGVEPVATCDPLNVSSQNPVHDDPEYVYAQPIIDPAWRGCFEISGRKFGGLVAHLSNKVCLKVVEAAGLMPTALCIKMMPRVAAWPKSFIQSAPNDASIGLYFFPGSESVVKPFDELTLEIIRRDSVLKVLFENAELLIFPSNHLPPPYWRFDGKYYLWGVFRGRQESQSHELGNCHIPAPGSKDFIESLRTSPRSPLSVKSGNMSDSPRSPLSLSNRVFASEKKRVH
ncbi:RING/FYVE/PHD zinc finger protein [Thalictrum thalictroides]|uniref:RING/FYVE/PHD zinc finger protein n=1 Tax=Thalictrum thalictroides TaxID=46969 RepID=A0A7J6V4Z4_THATH|nr:RING/FYVE/PHD zinc finger protein [Thalictrum thalictroides]